MYSPMRCHAYESGLINTAETAPCMRLSKPSLEWTCHLERNGTGVWFVFTQTNRALEAKEALLKAV